LPSIFFGSLPRITSIVRIQRAAKQSIGEPPHGSDKNDRERFQESYSYAATPCHHIIIREPREIDCDADRQASQLGDDSFADAHDCGHGH
jgi:hypothetical protein